MILVLPSFSLVSRLPQDLFKWKGLDIPIFFNKFFLNFLSCHRLEKKFYIYISILVSHSTITTRPLQTIINNDYKKLDVQFFFLQISLVIDSKKNFIYLYLTSILVLPSFSLILSFFSLLLSRLSRDPFKWKDWIYQFFFLQISLVTDSKKSFIHLYLTSILVLPSFSLQ